MPARRIRVSLLIAAAILGVACSSAAQELGKAQKIRIGIPSWSATYFSLIAAKKHGYYARHGVEVEVIVVHSAISPQALASGELDFDTSTTRDMSMALKGVPVRVVMALSIVAKVLAIL